LSYRGIVKKAARIFQILADMSSITEFISTKSDKDWTNR